MVFLRILSWLPLSAAGLLWAAVLGLVALWPQHPTGARQLSWRGATGQPLASTPSSCGGVTRFPLLVDQDRVWLPCPAAPDLPTGTFALLLPRRGEARLLEPLPEFLALDRVEGLLPGPGGRVGIVYRASARTLVPGGGKDVLVAAVADAEGWRELPERLPGGAGSRLLGLGWAGYRLEVALAPTRGQDTRARAADAVLVRVGDRDLPRIVTREEMCLDRTDCVVRAAWNASFRGWRFLVEDGGTLREVEESGAGEAAGQSLQVLAGLDLRVAGRMRPPNLPATHRLEPDGSILPAQPPPSGLHPLPSSLVVGDTRLETLSRFVPEPGEGLVHEWRGQRWNTVSGADGLLRVGEGTGALAAVARLERPCTHLASGFLVPSRRGLTLLGPEGCHVGLTASGQRADPLNLLEHLEYARRPHALPALLFVVLGLPALLIPASLSRRPRARDHRLFVRALLASCYVLGALPLLSWLWPLLS
ncbi:hypothetical protein CYFUS_007812 [Cystobacter fuscus]|uniref:Uncharacterized protein n=1 Tax=Cystobacter fuscus TaxID=43 RepID=A0A250JEK1_9BACT|nr:hypothetical protein CYFUS_007812 [Cystobacter fuscus]